MEKEDAVKLFKAGLGGDNNLKKVTFVRDGLLNESFGIIRSRGSLHLERSPRKYILTGCGFGFSFDLSLDEGQELLKLYFLAENRKENKKDFPNGGACNGEPVINMDALEKVTKVTNELLNDLDSAWKINHTNKMEDGLSIIQLYKCGTKVKLVGCDITGIIVDILIKKEAVQYGVAYYNKGDYISVLMIEEQFEVHEGSEKLPIGFKN